jgi:hypothetical protein
VQLTPLSTHWAPRKKNKKNGTIFFVHGELQKCEPHSFNTDLPGRTFAAEYYLTGTKKWDRELEKMYGE